MNELMTRPNGRAKTRFLTRFFPLLCLMMALSVSAESVKILVQSSPLAGSQYYELGTHGSAMKVGDRLSLHREPENKHDRNAIRVEWQGYPLGYLPRAENRALAAALDRGERLEARISKLRSSDETRDPWQRLECAVYLVL